MIRSSGDPFLSPNVSYSMSIPLTAARVIKVPLLYFCSFLAH
jgi:hypothetical protein